MGLVYCLETNIKYMIILNIVFENVIILIHLTFFRGSSYWSFPVFYVYGYFILGGGGKGVY